MSLSTSFLRYSSPRLKRAFLPSSPTLHRTHSASHQRLFPPTRSPTQTYSLCSRSLIPSNLGPKFSIKATITSQTTSRSMSFSNTSTGDAPADPYTTKSKDDIPLKEKLSEFTNFVETCKFGMMTTRIGETGQLTSRAMALAATVRIYVLHVLRGNQAPRLQSQFSTSPSPSFLSTFALPRSPDLCILTVFPILP